MKGFLFTTLLISFVVTKKTKTKLLENVNPELPEELIQTEDYLKKSAKEFDDLKKEAAIKNLKTQVLNNSLNLDVPHIESETPTSILGLAKKLEDDSNDKKAVSNEDLKNERTLEDEEGGDGISDEQLDDMEKRVFSIEDKIDHLLLHSGHDVGNSHSTMTPFGPLLHPQDHQQNSLNHKLKMIDYLHPHGSFMHPFNHFGVHPNVMMGIGHGNPLGVGLDHHYRFDVGMNFVNPFQGLWGLHHPYTLHHHPFAYGGLGYGLGNGLDMMYPHFNGINRFGYHTYGNPFSSYADEREEQRRERFDRRQKELDDIYNKPLFPPSMTNTSSSLNTSSNSLFLI